MRLPSVLEKICASKREEVEYRRARQPLAAQRARVADLPLTRDFHAALAQAAAPAIIAEFKRASPSAGWIAEQADPESVARAYASAGAACLSVLTDAPHFRGSDADLARARAACDLPVLRKDFIIDEYQVWETRAIGADALLLIVAALDDARLADFSALARSMGLSVLVEVHDRRELERALAVPGHLLGINNRDLHRFETRLETSEKLRPEVSDDRIVVAESGIHAQADIVRLSRAGIQVFLIGESLMRASDPAAALRALRGES